MTNAPNATAMIPIHAGAELTGGGPPDGAPGSGGALGTGGAAGSASVMRSQGYYASRSSRSVCQFGKGSPECVSLATRKLGGAPEPQPNERCLRAGTACAEYRSA